MGFGVGIDEVGGNFFIGGCDCVGVVLNMGIAFDIHDNYGARVIVSVSTGFAVDISENFFCLSIGVEVRRGYRIIFERLL